jgi:hypothetical protein
MRLPRGPEIDAGCDEVVETVAAAGFLAEIRTVVERAMSFELYESAIRQRTSDKRCAGFVHYKIAHL